MRNGATALETLIERNATDNIPLLNGNHGVVVIVGGRPNVLPRENYYDAKTGWPLNPDGGGKKYLTFEELMQLKGELLLAIRGANNGEAMQHVQAALGIVLEKLGEVAPDCGDMG